jgi:hypothetical protein
MQQQISSRRLHGGAAFARVRAGQESREAKPDRKNGDGGKGSFHRHKFAYLELTAKAGETNS